MSRHDKVLAQILGGRATPTSDSTASAPCCATWVSRSARGAATTYSAARVEEPINLQRDSDKAKVYQVRQVRAILTKYGLTTVEPPEEA